MKGHLHWSHCSPLLALTPAIRSPTSAVSKPQTFGPFPDGLGGAKVLIVGGTDDHSNARGYARFSDLSGSRTNNAIRLLP